MTPAIELAVAANISHVVHSYAHVQGEVSYGQEAARKLCIDPARVFKTLVVALGEKQFGVAVIPVSAMLNLKRVAKTLGAKRAEMARPPDVERVTGYVLGGVSPLGQKRKLATVIDTSAKAFATIYVSAGRRGLEIELAPADLAGATDARFAEVCQDAP